MIKFPQITSIVFILLMNSYTLLATTYAQSDPTMSYLSSRAGDWLTHIKKEGVESAYDIQTKAEFVSLSTMFVISEVTAVQNMTYSRSVIISQQYGRSCHAIVHDSNGSNIIRGNLIGYLRFLYLSLCSKG